MRQYEIHALDLRPEVKVLGYLLNALAHHSSLDDILCPHRLAGHHRRATLSRTSERIICEFGRDLRARSEDLSDFERTLELDDLDALQRVLVTCVLLLGLLGEHLSNFGDI